MDPLYGDLRFSSSIAELMLTPALQRLREIRLSNIDSVDMPGIANISRYEHVLGTAYLATRVGFFPRLTGTDALVFQASALLHDVAIAPFGHLVEEALQYKSVQFTHEWKLATLLEQHDAGELGNIELQVYAGHQSGIRTWADGAFGRDANQCLASIIRSIAGRSPYGGAIAGGLDVDNLDNLTRIAFHMGLDVDRGLPLRLAASILDNRGAEAPAFSPDGVDAVRAWLALRRRVYTRLMLSQNDFAGKAMLIFATVRAFERGELAPDAYVWTLTDREIVQRLLQSGDKVVVEAIRSWLLRDLWSVSDLCWMEGSAPPFSRVYDFSQLVTTRLGRFCFAYRIADKRVRRLSLPLDSGKTVHLGEDPKAWLLGVVSSKRGGFRNRDHRELRDTASSFFGVPCLGAAAEVEHDSLPLFDRP